jgi:hypothetical protein
LENGWKEFFSGQPFVRKLHLKDTIWQERFLRSVRPVLGAAVPIRFRPPWPPPNLPGRPALLPLFARRLRHRRRSFVARGTQHQFFPGLFCPANRRFLRKRRLAPDRRRGPVTGEPPFNGNRQLHEAGTPSFFVSLRTPAINSIIPIKNARDFIKIKRGGMILAYN